MALSHFHILNMSAFGFSLFYISSFLWHYPTSSISIIYAAINAYKNKIIKGLEEWKEGLMHILQRARE